MNSTTRCSAFFGDGYSGYFAAASLFSCRLFAPSTRPYYMLSLRYQSSFGRFSSSSHRVHHSGYCARKNPCWMLRNLRAKKIRHLYAKKTRKNESSVVKNSYSNETKTHAHIFPSHSPASSCICRSVVEQTTNHASSDQLQP